MNIHRQPIREPAAWTAASLGADPKQRLTRRLKPAELAAMDDLLRRTRSRAAWDISSRDVAGLAELADDIRSILTHGTGMVVIQGIDRARLSKEDCERIFWAIGTFLG